jgi:hypothetical protein
VPESRAEVIFEGGLPVLRGRPAGEARVEPWQPAPPALELPTPGRRGEDRLRLRFTIDPNGDLVLEAEDLTTGLSLGRHRLGPVR